IGTIGEQFVCGVGLSSSAATHEEAEALIETALALRKTLSELREARSLPPLSLRLGVHSGPFVAGIVDDTSSAGRFWPFHTNLVDVARCVCTAAAGCDGVVITSRADAKLRSLARRRYGLLGSHSSQRSMRSMVDP
ncbi:hypothetical protein T484DRAFT_1782250, partial [Baffinella frigidus]